MFILKKKWFAYMSSSAKQRNKKIDFYVIRNDWFIDLGNRTKSYTIELTIRNNKWKKKCCLPICIGNELYLYKMLHHSDFVRNDNRIVTIEYHQSCTEGKTITILYIYIFWYTTKWIERLCVWNILFFLILFVCFV